MNRKPHPAARRAAAEALEGRRLLAGQAFPGEGPGVAFSSDSVIADFNGDGNADLAVAYFSPKTITIQHGDGAGGFTLAQTLAAVDSPKDLALADFNGDGRPDLAALTAKVTGDGYRLFLGGPGGTFTNGAAVNVDSARLDSIVAGDFSGDGKADVATAAGDFDTVLISRGDGAGGFVAGLNSANTGGNTRAIDAADLDGDGDLDLVAAVGPTATIALPQIAGILNNGNGSFSVVRTLLETSAQSLDVADINADGKLDVLVGLNFVDAVLPMVGSGFGTFAAAPAVAVPVGNNDTVTSVLATDFDSDGKIDFVATTGNLSPAFSLVRGKGNGTFHAAVTTPLVDGVAARDAGDLNNDGRPDLAMSTYAAAVLLNTNGTYVFPQRLAAGFNTTAVATADFNGDGHLDLVSTEENASAKARVFLNDGTGRMAAGVAFATAAGSNDVATGDFNNDGRPDIVVANHNGGTGSTASVLTNNGAGGFNLGSITVGNGPRAVVVRDFNNDGTDDFATANTSGSVSIRLGLNGIFLFQTATLPANANAYGITSADFNNDGKADLAVSTSNSGVLILTGSGSGTFTTTATLSPGGTPFGIVATNLNGDAFPDLAVGNTSTVGVSIYLGTAGGAFFAQPAVPVGLSSSELAAADVDEDGHVDLLATTGNQRVIPLIRGRGNGTFDPVNASIPFNGTADGLAVSDFNGDGRFDFAAADYANDSATVVLNRRTNEVAGITMAAGTITLSGADATVSKANGVITVGNAAGTRRLAAVAMRNVVVNTNATIASDLGQRGGPRLVSLTAAGNVTLTSTQHLRTLSVPGRLTVATGASKLLRVADLVITPSSVIDLTTNDMILDFPFGGASPQAAVRSLLAAGRTSPFAGLTSSTAYGPGNPGNTALGYMTAGEYQSVYGFLVPFAGDAIDTAAILIRYTLKGDTDLDRGVSINDFNRLSSGFGTAAGKTWLSGDFDYDGGTSINDFNLLSANFGKTLAVPAPPPPFRKGVAPAKR